MMERHLTCLWRESLLLVTCYQEQSLLRNLSLCLLQSMCCSRKYRNPPLLPSLKCRRIAGETSKRRGCINSRNANRTLCTNNTQGRGGVLGHTDGSLRSPPRVRNLVPERPPVPVCKEVCSPTSPQRV